MAKRERCRKHGILMQDWGCPRCIEDERNRTRFDDSLGFRRRRLEPEMPEWCDSDGGFHDELCRVAFYETVCPNCDKDVWYFECLHGNKVYFHDTPFLGGDWVTECPAKNKSKFLHH